MKLWREYRWLLMRLVWAIWSTRRLEDRTIGPCWRHRPFLLRFYRAITWLATSHKELTSPAGWAKIRRLQNVRGCSGSCIHIRGLGKWTDYAVCLWNVKWISTVFSTSGSKMAMNLDYLVPLRNAIINPLRKNGTEGVHEAIEVMKSYNLLREDLTNLIELCQWKNTKNPFNDIEAKVGVICF